MLSRTHLLVGILVLFLISIIFDIRITLMTLLIAAIASLLPDIDQKSSRLGKRFRFVSLIFDHRGLMHTIWFAILFSIIVHETIGMIESMIFFIAYMSHILLDGTTKKGIYPLYPLRLRISGNIKVGSLKEIFFFYTILILGVIGVAYKKFFF